jgi:hypothetical protein
MPTMSSDRVERSDLVEVNLSTSIRWMPASTSARRENAFARSRPARRQRRLIDQLEDRRQMAMRCWCPAPRLVHEDFVDDRPRRTRPR